MWIDKFFFNISQKIAIVIGHDFTRGALLVYDITAETCTDCSENELLAYFCMWRT